MKLCHMLATETLKNHETHYHGAIEDTQLEFLENYAGKSGFFIKKFLINDKLNLNKWGVTWNAIQKDVYNFIGRPVVLTPKRDHPKVYEQENYRIGEIIDVGLNEMLHSAWQVSQITDKKAQKLIRERKVKFGSPTVLVYSPETVEKKNIGTNIEETWLDRFIPAQDALIGDPAYGKMIDFIPAICDGDGPACALKLSEVSASVYEDEYSSDSNGCKERYATIKDGTVKVKWESDQHRLLHVRDLPHSHVCVKADGEKSITRWSKEQHSADIGDDNINQLTIVPFVKSTLKKHFKAETFNQIVGYIRQADESKLDSYVERKIKILADENLEWDNDQVVAVAFSYCRKKSGELEKMLLQGMSSEILTLRDKASDYQKLENQIATLGNKLQSIKA